MVTRQELKAITEGAKRQNNSKLEERVRRFRTYIDKHMRAVAAYGETSYSCELPNRLDLVDRLTELYADFNPRVQMLDSCLVLHLSWE